MVDQVGPFEILGELGRGVVGAAFEARDASGRHVALHVLPKELVLDKRRRARFQEAIEGLLAFRHDGVASLLEISSGEDELALATELVEGKHLGELAPMDSERATRLLAAVADALAAAHARGLAHLDLRPENVRVTAEGAPKLLALGLAHAVRESALTSASAADDPTTFDSDTLGTPGYMAPEQLQGASADQRADQFVLGVLAYELISGKTAYSGDSPMERLVATLAGPPPLEKMPARLRPVLDRCLKKRPEERFESMQQLARALRGELDMSALAAKASAAAAKQAAPSHADSPAKRATRSEPRAGEAAGPGAAPASRTTPVMWAIIAVMLVVFVGLAYLVLARKGEGDGSGGARSGLLQPAPAPGGLGGSHSG